MTIAPDVVEAWRTEVAVAFYRRYAAMVRARDPHHLLLGIRYKGIPDQRLFTALSPYFDVNSINDYTRYGRLKPVYANLYKATGKPLMITEFSFSGFPEPGHQSFLFVDVYTQEHRGLGYAKYVRQAAQAPFVIGMHWFMWMDYSPQAVAPEIYPTPPDQNVGLVTHGETAVYEELGHWVALTNVAVDVLHQAAHWEAPPTPVLQRHAVSRFVPFVHGELSEWPPGIAVRPTISNALQDNVRVDHTYFLAWDEHALYLAAHMDDVHLTPPQPNWGWQADHFTLQLGPAEQSGTGGDRRSTVVIYPTGGADQQQPYAAVMTRPKQQQPLSLSMTRQSRPGGYVLEVRIPATAWPGFQPAPGTSWQLTIQYQNVAGIYQTRWEGLVTLAP
jgi:hypothetical protein